MDLNQYFSYNNRKCKYDHLLNAKTINHVKDNDFNDKIWIWPFIYSETVGIFKRKDLENTVLNYTSRNHLNLFLSKINTPKCNNTKD